MDEGSFDGENSRLQIKKLKEKVKSLVTEVALSREIKSDEFHKTSKLLLDSNVNDISSELDLSDEDSDEFLDIKEAEFINETFWLLDRNSNCNSVPETSSDIFKALYTEVEEFHEDISDLYNELKLLRNSSSSCESLRSCNRTALIDSRTFTRPKKYSSRPPLTSVISNSGDEMRQGRVQRRPTSAIYPTQQGIFNKMEDLSKANNWTVTGVRRDNNWEVGSEEGLADIENPGRKANKKSLPASIIDRLQELKKSNCFQHVSSKTPEKSRQLNVINGNVEESERIKVSDDANKVKAAFDLNVRNALSSSCMSDMFKNIPEYFSDDNESFLSLDDGSGFCDRLPLFTDSGTYSSIVREMEQNEIRLYHNASSSVEDSLQPPRNRLTFGGKEIPPQNALNITERTSGKDQLLLLNDDLNKTYEISNDSPLIENSTFEMKQEDNQSEGKVINRTYDVKTNQDLIDVLLKSDVIKKSYNYRNCDNKNILNSMGDTIANNVNETFTQNELNKKHSEKYTTKIFDASFRKSSSPLDKHNGKKDSDHSEDDCMSTTSDNSYKSVDSNSELKNIEELKNIALQQNMKLSNIKFSTPILDYPKSSCQSSGEWRNVSPIRKDILSGESQGSSSSASSRGPSPRGGPVPSGNEDPKKAQTFKIRESPKVPQRELKLKPVLVRPLQGLKKPGSTGKASSEPVVTYKSECKTSASAAGAPVLKPSIIPVTAVSSLPSSKPVTRIPSGIPRPPSRLKQPRIRAPEVYKK